MDLWIRSQDRESIFKVESAFYSTNEENEHFIRTFIIDDSRNGIVKLAQYSTKERALEVLDEINNIKLYKYMASLDWSSFVSSIYEKTTTEQKLLLSMMNTYQMPKE